jgi:hypothetical protein
MSVAAKSSSAPRTHPHRQTDSCRRPSQDRSSVRRPFPATAASCPSAAAKARSECALEASSARRIWQPPPTCRTARPKPSASCSRVRVKVGRVVGLETHAA